MNRRRRTRILIEGNPALAQALAAEAAAAADIVDVDPPSGGLVMLRMRDTARKDAFYLGEVLVTEAKVRIGESVGIGMVRGDRPDLARHLAVIDAACNAGEAVTAGWDARLESEETVIAGNLRRETAEILSTRVDFSTMETF